MEVELTNERPTRKLYKQTDWEKAGQAIRGALGLTLNINTKQQLDEAVELLVSTTAATTNDLTPTTKPCPYSKKWFSPDLKEHQTRTNKHRRLWQTLRVSYGRDDPNTLDQYTKMQKARREWVKAIAYAKSSH